MAASFRSICMIICPLCLAEVRPPAKFMVYCTQHPHASSTVNYDGSEDSLGRLHCGFDSACNQPQYLSAGVFLAHEGCTVSSPFWDSTKVAFTDQFTRSDGKQVIISDQQTKSLRELAQRYPSLREMWFPLGLFRAMNESGAFGKMVMLAGPKQVGKTVISTMAMNPYVYRGPKLSKYEPQAFLSLHILSGIAVSPDSFLRAVYAVTQLRERQPAVAVLPPTGSEEVHIKSVMLSAPSRTGRWEQFKMALRAIKDFVVSSEPPLTALATPHPTLALFDFAGERWAESNVATLTAHISRMHTVAVVMDALHLTRFGRVPGAPDTEDDPDSVQRAKIRLNMAGGKQRCLIITKLDSVRPDSRGEKANAYLDWLALNEEARVDNRARDILLSWLDPAVDVEYNLDQVLRGDPSIPVFFISTSNLDAQGRLGGNAGMPVSIGLRRFLLWALDWLPR